MMRHFAAVMAAALAVGGCAGHDVDVNAVGGEAAASELAGWDTPRSLFMAPEDPAAPVLRRRR